MHPSALALRFLENFHMDLGQIWEEFICDCCSLKNLIRCSSCLLKLEHRRYDSCSPSPVSVVLEKTSFDEKIDEFKKNNKFSDDNRQVDVGIKSSLKKPAGCSQKGVKKGKVKWMDFFGKELVEIREFKSLVIGLMQSKVEAQVTVLAKRLLSLCYDNTRNGYNNNYKQAFYPKYLE